MLRDAHANADAAFRTKAGIRTYTTMIAVMMGLSSAVAMSQPNLEPTDKPIVQISSIVLADGVSSGTDKSIPGAVIEHTIYVSNINPVIVTNGIVMISSPISQNLTVMVKPIQTPTTPVFAFEKLNPLDTSKCEFLALSDNYDCVEFSNNNGETFDYVPSPYSDGTDQNITNIRFKVVTPSSSENSDRISFHLKYFTKII